MNYKGAQAEAEIAGRLLPWARLGVRATWENGDLAWAGHFVIEINEEVRLGYLETRI